MTDVLSPYLAPDMLEFVRMLIFAALVLGICAVVDEAWFK